MSKSIKVFQNKEFGTVRNLIINDEPYFVGKDVAEIFGYRETAKAIRTHVDEEDKGVSVLDTPGGRQQITLINESGLYCLILSSNLPVAKKFKRWITSEVLPEIHRKGSYARQRQYQLSESGILYGPGYGSSLFSIRRYGRVCPFVYLQRKCKLPGGTKHGIQHSVPSP